MNQTENLKREGHVYPMARQGDVIFKRNYLEEFIVFINTSMRESMQDKPICIYPCFVFNSKKETNLSKEVEEWSNKTIQN